MSTVPDSEPTPEFNARCEDVFSRWQDGALPFKEAVDHLTLLAREAQRDEHFANQGRAQLLLGIFQGCRGNLYSSIEHFEYARDLFERAGNRRRALGCVLNLGESYRLKGDFTRARQLFHAAFEGAKEVGALDTQTIAALNEGQMLLSMDRVESARAALEKAYQLAIQIVDRRDLHDQLLCETQAVLALAHLRLRQPERSWYYALEALRLAKEINQPLQVGSANRAMGEILSTLGRLPSNADPFLPIDPDAYFQKASAAFQEMKAEGELARTMYVQALSLAGRRRGMTAARKLQQAMIIFTRLGMADDAAKAARAQMNVLANAGS